MPTVRQLASGLPYAIVSLVLVAGSLSLALAEKNASPAPAPPTTAVAFTSPTAAAPASATVAASPTEYTTSTATSSPVPTSTAAALAVSATSTRLFPTVRVQTLPSATSAHICGPFPGWVKGYLVQPGDTLFRIAVRFATTVEKLQHANCKTSSLIYAGEPLWVPNAPTVTPGQTIIPYFDTPTDMPTELLTATPDAAQTLDP